MRELRLITDDKQITSVSSFEHAKSFCEENQIAGSVYRESKEVARISTHFIMSFRHETQSGNVIFVTIPE